MGVYSLFLDSEGGVTNVAAASVATSAGVDLSVEREFDPGFLQFIVNVLIQFTEHLPSALK